LLCVCIGKTTPITFEVALPGLGFSDLLHCLDGLDQNMLASSKKESANVFHKRKL
jgi:hypothetical protein